MESMSSYTNPSFPILITNDTLDHDLAIRRFCPARLEQEEQTAGSTYYYPSSFEEEEEEEEPLIINDFDFLSPCAQDQMVDSFINVDNYQEPISGSSLDDSSTCGGQFPDDMDAFSILNDVFVDVPMDEEGDDYIIESAPQGEIYQNTEAVDQGLQLVHLLLACAEAVGCRDSQLAGSILGQIWASVNPWGDSLQRVSYCFAAGLRSRLSLLNNVNANGTFTNGGEDAYLPTFTREEKMEASQLLYQATPFVAFGFLAANEAICQASQGKDLIHVIDLGMEHTLQWPSLIRNLASRPEGQPKLRITGLINEESRSDVEGSMKTLIEDAASLGVLVEFNLVSEQVSPALFTREKLDLREGEAFLVNSIMNLHKFVKESRGSLKAILQAIKKLGPSLLTVVEQDANHNGPFFLGRFLESLHYYSAIFDSLEASLPRNSVQRMKIEKVHFAEEIRNIVACEGGKRIERHERADQWRRQLGRAGYQVMGLKCMSQARMMLSVYGCDGYTLASDKGCLLLGWKGRPIMLASAWQLHTS